MILIFDLDQIFGDLLQPWAVPSIDKRHVPLRDSEDVPAEVHVAVRGLEVAAEGDGGHRVHDAVVEALQAVPRYVGALDREVATDEHHVPSFWPTGRPDELAQPWDFQEN